MILKKVEKAAKLTEILTFGDHPLQTNDVLVRKLAHDGGFAEKILSLLLRVARLQRLDGYCDLFPTWHPQNPPVHLAKLPCSRTRTIKKRGMNGMSDLQNKGSEVSAFDLSSQVPSCRRLLCSRVRTGRFCLELSHRGVLKLGVERHSLCCIIGGQPVVGAHGNQLSHEEEGGRERGHGHGNWGGGER